MLHGIADCCWVPRHTSRHVVHSPPPPPPPPLPCRFMRMHINGNALFRMDARLQRALSLAQRKFGSSLPFDLAIWNVLKASGNQVRSGWRLRGKAAGTAG